MSGKLNNPDEQNTVPINTLCLILYGKRSERIQKSVSQKVISWTFILCRQRIPNKYVYYYRSPEHQNHYVLSFAFGFDREEDVYQFAFSYPYSYSRCQAHLELLERRQLPYIQRELLANTVVSTVCFLAICSTNIPFIIIPTHDRLIYRICCAVKNCFKYCWTV